MKQTTLKNLLIVIFCSLTLHTITPNFLYAEDNEKQINNGIKMELEGNVANGEADLSIEGNYKLVLSDDPSSMIQYLKSKIKIKNFVLDKTINKEIVGAWRTGWSAFGKTLTKELFEVISIETNPIPVLTDKELTLKLGLEEVKFGPYKRSALGFHTALDKLAYDMKIGVGFYTDVLGDSWKKFYIPIAFTKKVLISEEDSLKLNMTIATDGTTYYTGHNYLSFAKKFLSRFSGISAEYKTNSKDSILNSLKISCSSVIMGTGLAANLVKNKPAAKIETKINGSSILDFGVSALYNMLPEKTKELCGSLDTVNISFINHFCKKRIALYDDKDQVRAGFFEHVTLGLTATFKNVCQTKDTELEIGFNLKAVKPDHDSRFSFVVKFSKKFDVI